MPFGDSNIRFLYFRAKGARARVHFPATYFLYFVARFAQTPSLFFVNIMKEKKTQNAKNFQQRESISIFTSSTGLSVEITDKNGKIRIFGGEMVIEK